MTLKMRKESKPKFSKDELLPPEFKKFDKPFGLEDHVFDSIFLGFICHACALYYFLYLWPFGIIPRSTLFYVAVIGYATGLGITVGAHRLWAHKTFKANLPLRIILMLLQTAAYQYPIFKWCWQHRVHHKYTDTNADPYSASRGFWFSHITWLFQPKHPDVEEKRKTIDISDLARDPVVRFQSKYYWELWIIVFHIVPMGILTWIYPAMSFFHIFVTNCARFTISLHGLEDHDFVSIYLGLISHSCTLYYLLYLWPFGIIHFGKTLFWVAIMGYSTGFGITVGAHSLWAHKTFKANLPLRIIMMLLQTAAMQYDIFTWCWHHRVHHKYTDTDADPYNSSRGFWFSHITWPFQRNHPEVEGKRKTIDLSDLTRDPVVGFQPKHYWKLWIIVFLIIPMGLLTWLYPAMSFFHIFVTNCARYTISAHVTFLVNSAAHIWGDKPYDKDISPAENKLVSFLAIGEGWHNYHHTFPWDYKAAEFGYKINVSTLFIHFFSLIGWAWDLKTVSHKLLVDRINRTGDGSHRLHTIIEDNGKDSGNSHGSAAESKKFPAWGWGDEGICKEDLLITETLFQMERRD